MMMEEILAGESKNVEFKERLPGRSIQYMKSVVAFANGSGGKIIFGIADKTREVVGFEEEDAFRTMDAIANAVSDSCEPAIIPDITLQTVEDKTIIVVEVPEGRQRPYYIKSMGWNAGVYVRVAGTTRQADEYMIKELMFEGSNRYFDQTRCLGLEITEADIDALCKAMKAQAVKNAHSDEQRAMVKDVGRQQLLSWGVIIEREGKVYPSNAYAILTGCGALPVATQCGVFKGTTKEIFVDRREYEGPIWELIINAAVHRSYLDHGNIQVALYEDRLEITSPGKLPMGQNLKRMKEGYSQIRNEALARAFSYMNLIEHWGSGIPRIIRKVREAGLREMEFLGGDVDLRINIYRGQVSGNISTGNADKLPEDCRKIAVKLPGSEQERSIYQFVLENHSITTSQAAQLLGVKPRRARMILSNMVENHWLEKIGASRNISYRINE